MAKDDFCGVGDFPVLIPYRDVANMVEIARNMERYERSLSRANEQLSALRRQYAELMEKVRDISKSL